LISFSGKATYSYTHYLPLMRRFLNGRKEVFGQRSVLSLELEEAKGIIAEVFGIRRSDVEEMIRMRLEEGPVYDQEIHLD